MQKIWILLQKIEKSVAKFKFFLYLCISKTKQKEIMEIRLQKVSVREMSNGYKDSAENGVVGYGGQLDIRPKYQREFVYKDKQREAVIDTIFKGFPLNVMYWADNGDNFEVIDGQQRTISICQYVNGDFSYKGRYFHNLQNDEKEKVLNYVLDIYVCKGTDSEKLDWFRTINIAGEKLTEQELRNAVYSGTWVSDAKRYFSKTNCPAYNIASDYVNGSPIRQDYLETALDWISDGNIENYMAVHQNDHTAAELWIYFQSVISWVESVFTVKRSKIMKSVNWGKLYNEYKDKAVNPADMETEVKRLLLDEDVTKQSGIYPYLLSGNEKYLSIRAFSDKMKMSAYERQDGICPICGKKHDIKEMEADHITPWAEGGKTIADNCQMLCKECNRRKGKK